MAIYNSFPSSCLRVPLADYLPGSVSKGALDQFGTVPDLDHLILDVHIDVAAASVLAHDDIAQGGESGHRCHHADALMGTDGVVLVDPCIEFFLRTGFGIEDATGEELGAKAAMEALDLACRGGRARSSQEMVKAVFTADAIEKNFDILVGVEAAGEDLAVVGQDLLGNSVGAHGFGEVVTDRARCCPDHEPCHDAEP